MREPADGVLRREPSVKGTEADGWQTEVFNLILNVCHSLHAKDIGDGDIFNAY